MPTVVRVDLRSPAPHYTLTKDPDRTINGAAPLSAGEASAQAQAAMVIQSLAAANADVLNDLAREREAIFTSLRDGGPGPQTVLRRVAVDLGQRDAVQAQANITPDPILKRKLIILAGLEEAFAYAIAAAQQVVQDAVMAGAEWIFGDARMMAAMALRGNMVDTAVRDYNISLPFEFRVLFKLPFSTMGV